MLAPFFGGVPPPWVKLTHPPLAGVVRMLGGLLGVVAAAAAAPTLTSGGESSASPPPQPPSPPPPAAGALAPVAPVDGRGVLRTTAPPPLRSAASAGCVGGERTADLSDLPCSIGDCPPPIGD